MPNLHVIVCSIRVKRVGLSVGQWFAELAGVHGGFAVRLVDLREVNLPVFDEPHHPRLQRYEYEHTKSWSRTVAEADAFAFVTPEYNFSTPPALNNALHYLMAEWQYKPAGFVSYGGISAGTRGVQMSRLTVGALKMVAIPEAVHIPFIARQMEEGAFKPTPENDKAARVLLDELVKWEAALRTLR
jgi:NAD(P)H-dependent FMN reductase